MKSFLKRVFGLGGVTKSAGSLGFYPSVESLDERCAPSGGLRGLHGAHHAGHLHSRYFSDLLAVRAIPPSTTYTTPGWDMQGSQSVNPYTTYTTPGYDLQGGYAVNPYETYTTPGYDLQGGYSVNPYDTSTIPGYDVVGGESVDPYLTYIDQGTDFFGEWSHDPFRSDSQPLQYESNTDRACDQGGGPESSGLRPARTNDADGRRTFALSGQAAALLFAIPLLTVLAVHRQM